jgi:hypothetical protein
MVGSLLSENYISVLGGLLFFQEEGRGMFHNLVGKKRRVLNNGVFSPAFFQIFTTWRG